MSQGIRFITNSYWNHSAILFEGYVYEFNQHGKVVTKLSEWKYQGVTSFREVELVVNPNDVNGYYDFGVFVNELLFYLTGWVYFTNRNDITKWYCFEFCGYCIGMPNSWKLTGKDF
jgi:hypothetical protein